MELDNSVKYLKFADGARCPQTCNTEGIDIDFNKFD